MSDGTPCYEVWHSPPRHGKTELLIHGMARNLKRRPWLRIGFGTYSADLAESKARRFLSIAEALEMEFRVQRSTELETKEGGGLIARGVGGGWTGRGLDLLVVDDPIKERKDAESPTMRRRVADWFHDAAMTRLEPGASVVVNMARWHPNDLAGDLISDGWSSIRLPAVCDDLDDPNGRELGEVLWPEQWPLEALEKHRRKEYKWTSLYQGRPRPRGATLFADAHYYDPDALPDRGYRVAIGLDFGYTKKTSADYSVILVLRYHHGLYYVSDVIRRQVLAPTFRSLLKAEQEKHRCQARIYYGGGGEKGVTDLMIADGARIDAQQATTDKLVRALPVSEAWNDGLILLPTRAPWLEELLEEVLGFTGVNDDHDDQVDALAAAFDLLGGAGRQLTQEEIEANERRAEERVKRRSLPRYWGLG